MTVAPVSVIRTPNVCLHQSAVCPNVCANPAIPETDLSVGNTLLLVSSYLQFFFHNLQVDLHISRAVRISDVTSRPTVLLDRMGVLFVSVIRAIEATGFSVKSQLTMVSQLVKFPEKSFIHRRTSAKKKC